MTILRQAQYVMGTIVEIVMEPAPRTLHASEQAMAKAFAEFERIAQVCSRFDPDSELSKVNRSAADGPVAVSRELYDLLERGLTYTAATDSAFSVLLQPLVELWETASDRQSEPTPQQLLAASELCRPGSIVLCSRQQSVRFKRPGMGLNLDGLAKGYAADRAREVLRSAGVDTASIDAGSSTLNYLDPPGKPRSRYLLARDADSRRAVRFQLKAASVSTSGSGQRDRAIGGRPQSHLIHASTGETADLSLTATAVGSSGEAAEVASKVLIVKGYATGMPICKRLGLASAGFVMRSQAARRVESYEGSPSLQLREERLGR